MRSSLVFVHGLGGVGRANWPMQFAAFADAVFVTLPGFGDEPPQVGDWDAAAARVLESLEPGGTVVAHSYGALAAVHAATTSEPGRIGALVLCEPALYSLEGTAIAEHNARMRPIFDAAPGLGTDEFWEQFMLALTGRAAGPLDEASRIDAERARLQRAPWSVAVAEGLFERVPTLVITGGWNEEYEQIARAIVARGGTHKVLDGAGHRPQDHAEFNTVVGRWLSEHKPVPAAEACIALRRVSDADDPASSSLMADALVDGVSTDMLVDTGSPRSQLVAADAERDSGRLSRGLLGSAAVGERVVNLQIGAIRAEGLHLDVVLPESPGARNLAGLDMWEQCRFMLFVARARIEVGDARPAGMTIAPFLRQGTPHRFVPVEVARELVPAVFDTGAGISIIDAALASSHPSWFVDHSSAIGTDASGVHVRTPTAMMVHTSIAGHAMAPHRVAFLDLASATAHLEQPVLMILGLPAIEQFDWWLDFGGDQYGIVPTPD